MGCRWSRARCWHDSLAGTTDASCWRADSASAAEFARRIVVLYRDAALWQRLRDAALERMHKEHGRVHYETAVRQVLEA